MKTKTEPPKLPPNAGGLYTKFEGVGRHGLYFTNPHTGRVEPFEIVYTSPNHAEHDGMVSNLPKYVPPAVGRPTKENPRTKPENVLYGVYLGLAIFFFVSQFILFLLEVGR